MLLCLALDLLLLLSTQLVHGRLLELEGVIGSHTLQLSKVGLLQLVCLGLELSCRPCAVGTIDFGLAQNPINLCLLGGLHPVNPICLLHIHLPRDFLPHPFAFHHRVHLQLLQPHGVLPGAARRRSLVEVSLELGNIRSVNLVDFYYSLSSNVLDAASSICDLGFFPIGCVMNVWGHSSICLGNGGHLVWRCTWCEVFQRHDMFI